MKQLYRITTILLLFVATAVYAGGVEENSNQSVEWMMTQNRNASLDADAVYHNPAGTALMNDGVYLYVSNQFIYQPITVDSDNPNLNDGTYDATKTSYLFPDLYLVFKKWDMAFSLGLFGIGGGGTATYPDGLPSFENDLAATAAAANGVGVGSWSDIAVGGDGSGATLDALAGAGTTAGLNAGYGTINGYTQDSEFEGSSSYYSFQVNYAYAFLKNFSLSAGYRFIYAYNTYTGEISNLSLTTSLNNPVDSTFPIAPIAANFAKKKVDVVQTGMAHGVIVGMDAKPSEELNIGLKFQWCSPLKLKNDTSKDDTGMFPDGETTRHTLPMQIGLGFNYTFKDGAAKGLSLGSSANVFLNREVNWDGDREDKYNTGVEVGAGFAYTLQMVPLTLGASYGFGTDGENSDTRSDLGEGLDWHNVGVGLSYEIIKNLKLSVAYMLTYYVPADVDNTGIDVDFEKIGHNAGLSISYAWDNI